MLLIYRGLVRQLSIDQLDNEGRRVSIYDKGTPEHKTPMFQRTVSMPGVHKRVINELLRPRQWKPNHEDRHFMLSVGALEQQVGCSLIWQGSEKRYCFVLRCAFSGRTRVASGFGCAGWLWVGLGGVQTQQLAWMLLLRRQRHVDVSVYIKVAACTQSVLRCMPFFGGFRMPLLA